MTAERRLRQRPTETTVTKPPGWVSELPHEHTHLLVSGGAEGLTPPRTSTRRATSGARPARTSTDSLTHIDVQSLARDRLPRPITTDA